MYNVVKTQFNGFLIFVIFLFLLGCGSIESMQLGSIEAQLPIDPNIGRKKVHQCTQQQVRGYHTLGSRRLTQKELSLTILRLFGSYVHKETSDTIGQYSPEVFIENVSEFEPSIDQQRVLALSNLAFTIPDHFFSGDNTEKSLLLDDCFFNQQGLAVQSCKLLTINKLGLRIYRRPLTQNEIQIYSNMIGSEIYENDQQKVSALISSMILSPYFSHHIVEANNSPLGRYQVSEYTLASRISYSSSGSMPDELLFSAAASNKLRSSVERAAHARRLLHTTEGREHVRGVFKHIYKIGLESDPKKEYAENMGVAVSDLIKDYREEALNFAEHVVFERAGNFEDLLNLPLNFPPSENAAKIMGFNQASRGINDPLISNDIRKGMLMRPLIMLSPKARTSPIHRGNWILKNMLCMTLPEPDPDLILEADERSKELDLLNITSRTQAEHITSGASCIGCHSFINPPGFALESFGSLGEKRDFELIFDEQDRLLRDLEIDTKTRFTVDGISTNISNASELAFVIAKSSTGKACFTENLVKFTRFTEKNRDDACHLSEVEDVLRSGESIIEVLVSNSSTEDLRWEKTEE